MKDFFVILITKIICKILKICGKNRRKLAWKISYEMGFKNI